MMKRAFRKCMGLCLTVILLLTMLTPLFDVTPASAATSRYMGLNIGAALDYEGNLFFADAMKSARTYRNTADTADAALDSNGWPTQDFGIVVWQGVTKMNGTYALSFKGQATVAAGWGSCTISAISYNASTNTSTATLTYNSTDGAGLRLTFSNTKSTSSSTTNTGVKDIKLMRPITQGSTTSHATSEVFSRKINEVASKFKAFRFMDFTATNGKTSEVNWSDRVRPTYASQASTGGTGYGWQGKGSAWEYVVTFCNDLDADAWICVPVEANNDYITKLANLFKYGSDGNNPYTSTQANPVYAPLKAGKKIYIEYANELWNTAGAFSQSSRLKDKAVAEVNAGGSNLNYDGETDSWRWAWRLQARRTLEISNIFRSVWGDSAMMNLIRPSLMWQQGNGQGTASTLLSFLDNWFNNGDGNHVSVPHPVNYFIHSGSGSAYYNPANESDSLTIDNIWSTDTFSTSNWATQQKIDASYAAAYGLKRAAYEGGPSMDNVGHSENIKAQAWNDPRMKTLMIDHQKAWEEYEGDLLCYFTIGGDDQGAYYQWNFAKNIYDATNTSPKLQAIDALNAGSPSATLIGTLAPATLPGNSWSINSRGWGTPGSGSITMNSVKDVYGTPPLNWVSYDFRTTSSGAYSVKVNYSSSNAAKVDVLIDGQLAGTLDTNGTQGATATLTTSGKELTQGLHGVRLLCKTGPITVNEVSLNNGGSSTPTPTPTQAPTNTPTQTSTPTNTPTTPPSSSVLVDFENLSTGTMTGPYNDPAGYTFSNSTSANFLVRGTSDGFASKVLFSANWNDKIVITKTGGGNFNLTSFNYGGDPWGGLSDATITGYKTAGGTYTDTISSNSKTLSTKTLNWTGLSKVEIDYNGGTNNSYGAIDNFIFGTPVTTTTIGFEGVGTGTVTGPYNDAGGFTFANSPSADFMIKGTADGFASKVLLTANWADKITITKTAGGSFNFKSLDYGGDPWGGLADATITGFKADGSTVTDTISSSSKTLSTKTFNWTGLTRVEINYNGGSNGSYGATDNYVFN